MPIDCLPLSMLPVEWRMLPELDAIIPRARGVCCYGGMRLHTM